MHSSTYKTWLLHKIYADKALYRIKIYRNCIKIHQIDKVQKYVKNASKFEFRRKPKLTTILPKASR